MTNNLVLEFENQLYSCDNFKTATSLVLFGFEHQNKSFSFGRIYTDNENEADAIRVIEKYLFSKMDDVTSYEHIGTTKP